LVDKRLAVTLAALCAAAAGTLRASPRHPQQECPVPGQPTGLVASVQGLYIALSWQAPSGPVSSYDIEVGLSPGVGDVAVIETGTAATSVAGVLATGVYFVQSGSRILGKFLYRN
jgi:hypothetical protein